MSHVARRPRPLDLFEPVRELGREPTTDDFTTPPEIVERLNVYGEVGLDPATNATSFINARRKVMLPDDGLAIGWAGHGLVWCNPPYSDPLPWVKQGIEEADEAIYLLPTQTGTEWGARLLAGGTIACFYSSRVRFWLDGIRQPGAQFSSMIVGVRVDRRRFRAAFAPLGKVVLL